ECVAVPAPLLSIWSAEQVTAFFLDGDRPILCRYIEDASRQELIQSGCVDQLEKSAILSVLEFSHLAKPATWQQLLSLWIYLSPAITGYRYAGSHRNIRIVPAQARDVLYAASEVVRLGERKLLGSSGDWEFLAEYLLVLNQDWLHF